jgi:hypothetical protein
MTVAVVRPHPGPDRPAYAFAHYFTLVIFEGQLAIAAISDPFGLGWNLPGRWTTA